MRAHATTFNIISAACQQIKINKLLILFEILQMPLPPYSYGLFFFGLYPLAPLCISTTAALKPLLG